MAHSITLSKNFSYNLLKQQLELTKEEKIVFKSFLLAYEGDYWQNSKGFLGPVIEQSAAKLFKDRFISRNILLELVSRISDAFLKSPNWYIEKDGEKLKDDDKLKEEIDKYLTRFWDKQNIEHKMQKAINSRLVCSRGGIREYVPATKKNKDGTFKAKDLNSAFESVKTEFVNPRVGRLLDEDGDKFSIVNYKKKLSYDTNEEADIIEFSFVDDNGNTFIGIVSDKEEAKYTILDFTKAVTDSKAKDPAAKNKKDLSTPLDLDSETTYFEVIGEPFVSQQLMQLASFLNLCLTLAGIAIFETGFQQVITTNAEFDYKEVPDPEYPGKTKKVPTGIKSGGGVVQNFVGIEKVNLENGQKDLATPGVTIKPPVDMTAFKVAKDLAYESCLEEASQSHVLMTADATASAISRIQAMANFYLRIKKYKADVDALGTWVLTSALKFVAIILPGQNLENLKVVFDSKIDIGPLTPEEKNFVITMVNNGIISKETARVLLNIDNPTLEKLLVEQEQADKQQKDLENAKQMQQLQLANPNNPNNPNAK